MSTIEARLDALESRWAIKDLASRYAQAFDRHDREWLRSLWFEDSVLNLGPAFGDPFVGIDNIMSAAEQLWAKTPLMHHWMANPLITLNGDKATAETALDCFVVDSEDGPTQVGGLYTDDWSAATVCGRSRAASSTCTTGRRFRTGRQLRAATCRPPRRRTPSPARIAYWLGFSRRSVNRSGQACKRRGLSGGPARECRRRPNSKARSFQPAGVPGPDRPGEGDMAAS